MQEILLNKLRNIHSYGWQYIVVSDRIKNVYEVAFGSFELYLTNASHLNNINLLLMSSFEIVYPSNLILNYKKGLQMIKSIDNSNIKYMYLYHI